MSTVQRAIAHSSMISSTLLCMAGDQQLRYSYVKTGEPRGSSCTSLVGVRNTTPMTSLVHWRYVTVCSLCHKPAFLLRPCFDVMWMKERSTSALPCSVVVQSAPNSQGEVESRRLFQGVSNEVRPGGHQRCLRMSSTVPQDCTKTL